MKEKEKLIHQVIKKVETEPEFLALYINQYLTENKMSEKELIKKLGCTRYEYYLLHLCKYPEMEITRMEHIAAYCNISVEWLREILTPKKKEENLCTDGLNQSDNQKPSSSLPPQTEEKITN